MLENQENMINPFARAIIDLYESDSISDDVINDENLNINNLIGLIEAIQRTDIPDELIEILKITANFIICYRFNLEPNPIEFEDIVSNLRFFIRIRSELVIPNNLTETNEFFSNQLISNYIFETIVPDLERLMLNYVSSIFIDDVISLNFEGEKKRIPASKELIKKINDSKHLWNSKKDGEKCLICFERLEDTIVITCGKCRNSICSNCININLKYDHRCAACRSDLSEYLVLNKVELKSKFRTYRDLESCEELKISDFIPIVETKKKNKKDVYRKNKESYKKDKYKMNKKNKFKNSKKSRVFKF